MLNKTFQLDKEKINKLNENYKIKMDRYNKSGEELLKIKSDTKKSDNNFENSLKDKYNEATVKTIANFDLIRYSQSELISKLHKSIKDQGKLISNYSFQIIDSLRKVSELNNTVILQQNELIDREQQLEVSKQ